MKLEAIAKLISEHAPTVGAMVGSPGGGVIIGLIARAIGESNSGSLADKMIHGCIDTANSLKQLEKHPQLQAIGAMAGALCEIARDVKR